MKAEYPSRNIPAHREGWTPTGWPIGQPERRRRARPGSAAPDRTATDANVLIVDDDPNRGMAIEALLVDMSPRRMLAASGEEALRHLLEMDFAVILIDAKMQASDASGTARMIRERSRSTPIIFLADSHEDAASKIQGLMESGAGPVDCIVRPVIPDVLRSKIAVFVELHQMHGTLGREIAERRKVEAGLRTSRQNLRALAARQQSIVEEESIRIAREIHDELGQSLTALKMTLTWIVARLPQDKKVFNGKIDLMFRLIDGTIQAVRRISAGLRPEVLDQLGLVAACRWQARDFQVRTGIRCRAVLPQAPLDLDRQRSIAVFRVFQELLTNVARHAHATRVDVVMEVREGILSLEVRDDGKGFAGGQVDSSKSLGFLGMRERVLPFAGSVEVVETSASGATVRVAIPLQ